MVNLSSTSKGFVDRHKEIDFSCFDPWVNKLRKDGLESFSNKGFPTPDNEDWKYTSLKVLDNIGETSSNNVALVPSELAWLPEDLKTNKLVFLNGELCKDLSDVSLLSDGVKLMSLSDALSCESDLMKTHLGQICSFEEAPIIALNTAFISDGFVIFVENTDLKTPIEVVFVSNGNDKGLNCPRNLIIAKDNAHITILERHIGLGVDSYITNSTCEILIDGGASVSHYRVLEDSQKGVNLSSTVARVGKDASYNSFILSTGGKLSRSEIRVSCEAAGAHTNLNGVYIARDEQHMDHTTFIEHLVPNTSSKETYKGVLDDKARGVFQGTIVVADGADGTDGRMSNNTLLLSNDAEINAKPQLEIHADDVQCAHGFTSGELDSELLFYLRSRGIPSVMARWMLIEGFLADVVDSGVVTTYREIFKSRISDWVV